MTTLVRPELPTAALRSQATHATVDNSASFAIRPDSTYKSGKVVQTTGATSSQRCRIADIGQVEMALPNFVREIMEKIAGRNINDFDQGTLLFVPDLTA